MLVRRTVQLNADGKLRADKLHHTSTVGAAHYFEHNQKSAGHNKTTIET
jgi:hypothetical protein